MPELQLFKRRWHISSGTIKHASCVELCSATCCLASRCHASTLSPATDVLPILGMFLAVFHGAYFIPVIAGAVESSRRAVVARVGSDKVPQRVVLVIAQVSGVLKVPA